jgi:hypothetical protein
MPYTVLWVYSCILICSRYYEWPFLVHCIFSSTIGILVLHIFYLATCLNESGDSSWFLWIHSYNHHLQERSFCFICISLFPLELLNHYNLIMVISRIPISFLISGRIPLFLLQAYLSFFFFSAPWFELRVSHLLSRCSYHLSHSTNPPLSCLR